MQNLFYFLKTVPLISFASSNGSPTELRSAYQIPEISKIDQEKISTGSNAHRAGFVKLVSSADYSESPQDLIYNKGLTRQSHASRTQSLY